MSKSEANPKSEIRSEIGNAEGIPLVSEFGLFEFRICFEFRISNFEFLPS